MVNFWSNLYSNVYSEDCMEDMIRYIGEDCFHKHMCMIH